MSRTEKTKFASPLHGFHGAAVRYPLPALLCVFLFAALNIDFPGVSSWHDGQRLLQIATLIPPLLMCAWGCAGADPSGPWQRCPAWMRGALALALLLGLCSAGLAALPRWALLEWSMTLCLGLLAMGVAASCIRQDAQRDIALIGCIYATALAYSLKAALAYGLMFLVDPDYQLAFSVEELFPGFSNVRFFGHVQTMLLPFLVLPALWWTRRPWPRVLLLLVPAIWWTLAIASGTRGSWVALLIGALVASALGGAAGKIWLRWQLGALLMGGLCYLVFILGLPELMDKPAFFLHRTQDLISLRGREILWALSVDLLAAHPWLGIGPMHFAHRLSVIASHPHNAVLQWMTEWGIPAALLMTAVAGIGGLRFALRVYRSPEAAAPAAMMRIALLAALTGAAVQSMVDGVLVMPVSQMLLVLLGGWAWGWSLAERPGVERPEGIAVRSGSTVRILAVLSLLCLLGSAWPEITRLEERLEAHLKAYPQGSTPRLLPRFWIHGWIP